MGILDKAKEMLGIDEAADAAKDAAAKTGEAVKGKTDGMGGLADKAKDAAKDGVDSVAGKVKDVAPDSMDKHVDTGGTAVKDGIDKIGS